MTLRITVVDLETGDSDTGEIRDGDYMVIAHAPCRVHHTQVTAGGSTHVVTIKDRIERGVVLPSDDEPIDLVPTGTTNSQEG